MMFSVLLWPSVVKLAAKESATETGGVTEFHKEMISGA
jgi:hypothetical protein